LTLQNTHESTSDILTLPQIHGNLPPGITLVSAEGFEEWFLDLKVLDANPIYLNQTYRLKFKFSPQYPIGNYPPLSLSFSLLDT
jgi:hypothetical protein